MLVESQYLRIEKQLVDTGHAQVESPCGSLCLTILAQDRELLLSGIVFSNNDYIPPSVRHAIDQAPNTLPNTSLCTGIRVEEPGTVSLTHITDISKAKASRLQALIEKFTPLVTAWQSYLDDEGRKDLLHVRS